MLTLSDAASSWVVRHLSSGDPVAAALVLPGQVTAWLNVLAVLALAILVFAVVAWRRWSTSKRVDRPMHRANETFAILCVAALAGFGLLALVFTVFAPRQYMADANSLRAAVASGDYEVRLLGDSQIVVEGAFRVDTLRAFGEVIVRRESIVVAPIPYSAVPRVERALALEGMALALP
jgi:hypothetical protein